MPRPDVSEERRPQIIDAAIRLFVSKGYRKTTMADIAREAGLSIGGVYWYYKSKDAIIDAILDRTFDADRTLLTRLLAADAPTAERLRAFVDFYLGSFDEWQWINTIGTEFYSEAVHDAKVQAVIVGYLGRYRDALAALIEQGIQRGEFRSVNAIDAANVFLGLEEGLSIHLAVDAQHTRWRESFLLGCELIIAGLRHAAN